MKKTLLAIIFFALSSTAMANVDTFGLHCGPRGNFWSAIFSDFLIPDYFPPENALVSSFLLDFLGIDVSECADYTSVHLGESCMMHDQCYGTLGVTKDGCDEDLLLGWQTACMEGYTDENEEATYCKSMCQDMTKIMYDLMSYNDGEFCPSCIAFEKSQEEARREMSPN